MGRFSLFFLVCSCCTAGPNDSLEDPRWGVEVLVFDQAGVPPPVLERAGDQLTGCFRGIGVSVRWILCQTPGRPPCDYPATGRFVLRIIPERFRRRWPVRRDHHGFALTGEGSEQGFFAGVFYEPLEREAEGSRVDRGGLLGLVAAHELGHLLLGGGGHAVGGIMKHPWHRKEFDLIRQGAFHFDASQGRIIRKTVARLALHTM